MPTKPVRPIIRVRLLSPELRLRVEGDGKPHSTEIEQWRIYESFEPDRYREGSTSFGSYRVHLDYDVPPDEDAGSAYIAGYHYARELDRAWNYATGLPLGGKAYEMVLLPSIPPPGWISNAAEALSSIEWDILQSRVSYVSRDRVTPWLPLKEALKVMDALRDADDVTDQIGAFHAAAMTVVDRRLPFLLFAQGLEAADPFLRGSQAVSVPTAVTTRLKRNVDWVYMISNQRRETRHSTDRGAIAAVKPGMNDEERQDFLHDADLLLHFVVIHRLGLPLVLSENGRTVIAT